MKNDILTTLDESRSLWSNNEIGVEDAGLEMAVLVALDKPHDAPDGRPLLRRGCAHSTPVRSLFAAVFGRALGWTNYDLFRAPCDRCLSDVQPRHTLWIPAGRSVVEVHVCDGCRSQLDADFAEPALIWN